MPEDKKALQIKETRISERLDVGLQYFLAIDAIIGLDPSGKVRNQPVDEIKLYRAAVNHSDVSILRFTAHYDNPKGEITAKQDEIALHEKDYRLQFNAQMQNGDYIKYPTGLELTHIVYLQETIGAFAKAAQVDGSFIWVNGRKKMVASNGVWVEADENLSKGGGPALPGSSRRLPPGQSDRLIEAAHVDAGLNSILNQLLGVKERVPQRT